MEIFGKHIFGTDADAWLKLCKDQKKEWILKHTNQTDETLIDEFIKNPKISKECKCLDCGKNGNTESPYLSSCSYFGSFYSAWDFWSYPFRKHLAMALFAQHTNICHQSE